MLIVICIVVVVVVTMMIFLNGCTRNPDSSRSFNRKQSMQSRHLSKPFALSLAFSLALFPQYVSTGLSSRARLQA